MKNKMGREAMVVEEAAPALAPVATDPEVNSKPSKVV
jgi:hypothetical protein